MGLFGSSGIRGLIGKDIDAELGVRIGRAVGGLSGTVVVGKDPRTSGDLLVNALTAGLIEAGAEPYRAGMVPTPTLACAASHFDCGLMVTASHNPPEYNGVKMWNQDGSAFDGEQTEEVERLIAQGGRKAGWDEMFEERLWPGAIDEHILTILEEVGPVERSIVLDCGCGATGPVSPRLFRDLGCNVVAINANPDGRFPGRPSEPSEANLGDLMSLCKAKGMAGIAHDGDGDRMVAVDEDGRYVSGDRLLALFASLLGVKDMAAPVDASMVLDDIVGRPIVRTRVGDMFVSEALKKQRLPFGGEPSGTFIFPSVNYCPDGMLAGAYLLKLLDGRPLKDVVSSLPIYPSARDSFSFDPSQGKKVKERLAEEMSSLDGELTTVDGYRVDLGHGWLLVRLSGTEPKVRLTAEARNRKDLDQIAEMARSRVRKALG
ncbi:Phosphoglucosamine mutase [anaerobic digester metagenome]|jgi:phosphoglucosamine mutase|nr:phosphoglucosamine mutase [Methanomassiliicoccales archaeon]